MSLCGGNSVAWSDPHAIVMAVGRVVARKWDRVGPDDASPERPCSVSVTAPELAALLSVAISDSWSAASHTPDESHLLSDAPDTTLADDILFLIIVDEVGCC